MSLILSLTALLGWAPAAAEVANTPPRWALRFQPARIVNGSPVLFRITAPRQVRTLSGKWLDHEISFNFEQRQRVWYGLAGASLETKPGIYPLELSAETSAGKTIKFKQGVRVRRQRYPKVTITVAGKYTAPDAEQLKVIEHDKLVKADAFKAFTADRRWQGAFEPPVKAEISDVFGVQRVFNGVVQSTHQGLDFRVHAGTPVSAVNSGTILLARFLYFEGNCVVIDHGQGLLTLYLHLSEIHVKEGDRIQKGQEVGLSGSTGRATGPHLHLAVRWQGVYLNPAALLSLKLP
ncbi:MAG TPA: M23 family metallopeptidase [Terriglobales bacterium]|nr:M23 family metallopeptidase [Terriglobales bacterium]